MDINSTSNKLLKKIKKKIICGGLRGMHHKLPSTLKEVAFAVVEVQNLDSSGLNSNF